MGGRWRVVGGTWWLVCCVWVSSLRTQHLDRASRHIKYVECGDQVIFIVVGPVGLATLDQTDWVVGLWGRGVVRPKVSVRITVAIVLGVG